MENNLALGAREDMSHCKEIGYDALCLALCSACLVQP